MWDYYLPELPEVEMFKKYFDATSLHKKIKNVTIKCSEILMEASRKISKLQKHSFQSTLRYGKYLFVKTDEDLFLVIHFGMTGNLEYYKQKDHEPSHSCVLFEFDNGFFLSYVSQRKFGKIDLTRTVKEFVEEKNLGPDILTVDCGDFKKIIEKRRGSLKYTLTNQHIIAGIGNIYSDEILFQAGIHPLTKANNLPEKRIGTLFNTIHAVLRTVIDAGADFDNFPGDYLIPHRVKGGVCPKDKSKLKRIKISGRTTYYCPKHQKKLN